MVGMFNDMVFQHMMHVLTLGYMDTLEGMRTPFLCSA